MNERIPPIPEPDEQFIDALEQRLHEGIRRRARLDPAALASSGIQRKGMNMLATASLMLLSLMLGAAGTYTVVHQDLAPQRELHLEKATILLERAQVRLEQRKADLAELLPRVEQGLVHETVAARYRQKLSQAESEMRRRELDLAETRITGRAPVDDLSGPLVGGEDFIARRLEAHEEAVKMELRRVQAEFSRAESLAERGLVSERELIRARADLEEAEQALVGLRARMNLRQSFITGDMTAEEVELCALRHEAEAEHAVAKTRLGAAKSRMQRLADLHERGMVSGGELLEAQTGLRDAESNLALVEVQLKMMRQRLEALEQQD